MPQIDRVRVHSDIGRGRCQKTKIRIEGKRDGYQQDASESNVEQSNPAGMHPEIILSQEQAGTEQSCAEGQDPQSEPANKLERCRSEVGVIRDHHAEQKRINP